MTVMNRGIGCDRALVLSGGGPVGIAWELGLAAGLRHQDVDLRDAELIVGTSAGSVVGSLIALDRDLDAELERFRGRMSSVADRRGSTGAADMRERMLGLMEAIQRLNTSDAPETERLAEMGRFALETPTADEDAFVESFGYAGAPTWPERFICTAVDANTGAFTVWDADAGVEHQRAVASSCAVPGVFPTIGIGDHRTSPLRRYYDGGLRSLTNADLASGAKRVLIVTIASIPEGSDDPRAVRMRARQEAEAKAIADGGGTSLVVAPDDDARAVIGINFMDPSVAPAAATAGFEQAARVAAEIAAFWN